MHFDRDFGRGPAIERAAADHGQRHACVLFDATGVGTWAPRAGQRRCARGKLGPASPRLPGSFGCNAERGTTLVRSEITSTEFRPALRLSGPVAARRHLGTEAAVHSAFPLNPHPESNAMKKHVLVTLTLAALGAAPAFAQTAAAPAAPAAAAAPTPDWTFSANLGLFSDYRFRGISQTNKEPALQGGFDLGHSSGFYIGNWNSNVDSKQYNGANLEMDFYGGYKHSFDSGFGIDVGAYYYYYPGSGANSTLKIDNTELYIGGSYGPVSLKYNYAVSDFFSAPNSKGSSYLDLGFAYDLGNNFGVVAHYGYQTLKGGAIVPEIDGSTPDNISDWKLGGTYTIDGWALGLAYIATNRNYGGYTVPTKNISNGTAVLSVAKTF
jgi:uncharacterized protein (TIGR02001 family)